MAVDDRRQVHLARRDPELGDVRDPQLVRVRGVEVPVHEIGRRAATGTSRRSISSLELTYSCIYVYISVYFYLELMEGQRNRT